MSVGRGAVDRPRKGGDGGGEHDPEQPAAQKRHAEEEGEGDGPDEVELLLDRECPELLHRRGRLALREVVAAGLGEVHVRHEERGPDAVAHRFTRAYEVQQQERGHVGDDAWENENPGYGQQVNLQSSIRSAGRHSACRDLLYRYPALARLWARQIDKLDVFCK